MTCRKLIIHADFYKVNKLGEVGGIVGCVFGLAKGAIFVFSTFYIVFPVFTGTLSSAQFACIIVKSKKFKVGLVPMWPSYVFKTKQMHHI